MSVPTPPDRTEGGLSLGRGGGKSGGMQEGLDVRVAAGLKLICPQCQGVLAAVKHETGIAWRCGGCGGQSLNFSQFRRLIPELQANGIWASAMERPVTRGGGRGVRSAGRIWRRC